MKILDLFCGAGGWSEPFVEYGDHCVGIDIKPNKYHPYPGYFVQQDITTVNGRMYEGFDLIIGSPPCIHFSDARYRSRHIHGLDPTPNKGFGLIDEFWRIVDEAKPKFYAMENIKALTKYYDKPYQWEFKISKGGKRCLWTNLTLPMISQFEFKHRIRDIPGWDKHRWKRAFIPYEIARYVADVVHSEVEVDG